MPDALAVSAPARLQLAAEPPAMLNGEAHVGVAIGLSTDNKPSALVVPDVTAVGEGVAPEPVYLAKPLKLYLDNILDYLESTNPGTKKQITESNPKLAGFLKNTSVSIDSFYYRGAKLDKDKIDPKTKKKADPPPVKVDNGLLLMQFGLNFTKDTAKGGLIASLTGDENLSKLFEITGISLRVLRCDKDNVELLQNYVDGLFAE